VTQRKRVLYPDRVTPDRQQEMLDELLGWLRGSRRAGASGPVRPG